MIENPVILKTTYRDTVIIYFSLVTGVILFQLVTILMNEWQIPPMKPGLDILNIVSIVMLLFIPVGFMVSNRLLSTIPENATPTEKIMKLRSAYIVRWAMIEGPVLFGVVVFLLLNDGKQLIVFLVGLLAFGMSRPTREKMISDAKLNSEDLEQLPDLKR